VSRREATGKSLGYTAAGRENQPVDETSERWERVVRLDADELVAEVHERTGLRLTVDGPCPGGEVGAAYVRWPDGHRSVLTSRRHADVAELRAGPLAVVDALREVGPGFCLHEPPRRHDRRTATLERRVAEVAATAVAAEREG
jgi:hypothetical protein